MDKNSIKKFINNFKKILEKNILIKYLFYLLVIILIWGILQLIFPDNKTNSNNVEDINTIINTKRTNNTAINSTNNNFNTDIINNTIDTVIDDTINNSITNSLSNEI